MFNVIGHHVTQFPNKTWGFVGSVLVDLGYKRVDNQPLSEADKTEIIELLTYSVPRVKTCKVWRQYCKRSWPSRNAALNAAKALNATVSNA